jgi:hypothetical protein
MEVSRFSFWQHVADPFHLVGEGEEKKVEVLTLREKVQAVALAIIAASAAILLPARWTFVMLGVTTFYALTAYHKVSFLNRTQHSESKEEEEEDVQAYAQNQDEVPIPASPDEQPRHKEQKKEVVSPLASAETASPLVEEEEDFVFVPSSPSIEAKQVTQVEQPATTVVKIASFFETHIKSCLDAIVAKAANPNLCFIKNDSAAVSTWFQNEYKGEGHQKKNFLFLQEKHPEIEQGVFISIRGDGDCTFRAIGTGLLLQSLSDETNPTILALLEQCKQKGEKLKREASSFAAITKRMQAEVDLLRREAQESEDLLQQEPAKYRNTDDTLNDEGQPLKATLDEKRDIANILEAHLKKLQETEYQLKIQVQIEGLVTVANELSQFSTQFNDKKDAKEVCQATLEMMQQEGFDKPWIQFLRKAAALNLILNMDKMEGLIKQLQNQEKVIAGEISMIDLLLQRADARQPNEDHLQGSINEAHSLSMLFDQPLSWYRCEVYHEPTDRMIHTFLAAGQESEHKKLFFVLNRPGHSDLILV